ncbi:alpha/beta hydrolase [Caulobacter segnis]|uniref:Alpha/beta hydrolase n=2 Tax=Caulobacter segnis TaxID=88688 RepID=D5VKS8_CAUST|nr:alpha/beta fold hydrolase [Caulobacter segnis]ADG11101.1 protein of unknown function DUF900 hydrolase family protein [Caulobacter segnis ATCC 21756]AVQ02789.1 alpha/beta hydrolase [Caulobacter segnis]
MGAVRVYFATNRNHQPDNVSAVFGPRFNQHGVAALRFGHVDFDEGVKKVKDGARVKVYEDIQSTPDPLTEPDLTRGGGLLLEGVRQAMCAGRDTLVFIHGFNVSFNEALEAGALLARQVHALPADGNDVQSLNVVVFSWPSDGEKVPFMSYYSDREDARASGPALARTYLKLRDFLAFLYRADAQRPIDAPSILCERGLHLMAHSMGAYVLRQGLQALLAKDADGLVRLFDQIVLASPDEDDDTFEYDTKLKLLPRLGKRVTVYFNPRDRALWISDKTKTNPDRLGADGPRLIDLLPKKVALVDCRRVAGVADPLIQHSYYVDSPAMVGDIGQVLGDVDIDAFPHRQWIGERRVWRIEVGPA